MGTAARCALGRCGEAIRKLRAIFATAQRHHHHREQSRDAAEQKSQPGTGYGEEQYSPTYRVAFEAEPQPRERTFIKYEWRSTLCRMGLVPADEPTRQGNRLWDGEFAPPPPRRGW